MIRVRIVVHLKPKDAMLLVVQSQFTGDTLQMEHAEINGMNLFNKLESCNVINCSAIIKLETFPAKMKKSIQEKLEELTNTIWKKSLRAWSYTHKPMTKSNLNAVKKAIEKGFVINASADTLKEADELKAKGLPVAVTLHRNTPRTSFTPAGNKVVVCPAQYREEVNCSNCQLCLKKNRSVIVGFWAHGRGAKYVESAIDNANK